MYISDETDYSRIYNSDANDYSAALATGGPRELLLFALHLHQVRAIGFNKHVFITYTP